MDMCYTYRDYSGHGHILIWIIMCYTYRDYSGHGHILIWICLYIGIIVDMVIY